MGRSFRLAAYRAVSRRSGSRTFKPSGPRPDGELVWLHAAEPANLLAIIDLAARLCTARLGLQVLITLPDAASLATAEKEWHHENSFFLDQLPSEHPDAVSSFLRNWQPDMCIWTWGKLNPNLVTRAQEAGCPMALIDADTDGFDSRLDRWVPELSRGLLSEFLAILVRSDAARTRLEGLGIEAGKIDLTPPLQAGGQALACGDSDLLALARILGGRPVWLAANLQEPEISIVLSAHRRALRLSHRLLLILHPEVPDLMATMHELATADGFRLCDWNAGEDPSDTTQVMLATDDRDLGLFYRVSPVSFLGSSLQAGRGGHNPFDAAALGSAVLYGPNVRQYLPFYTRLANAGAARMINDAASLGTAVTRLIAPDQAAAMAHAGWDVISQGAALTDKVIDLVQNTLDAAIAQPNARA